MKRRQRRLSILLGGLCLIGAVGALVLSRISDNLVFFYSPSELVAKGIGPGRLVRIGGLVEQHSLVHEPGGRTVRFRITDGKTDIGVVFTGILPDLFREGQGTVVEGRLNGSGVFVAAPDGVLAKHDENYMPPEVAAALKKAGRWQEGGKATP